MDNIPVFRTGEKGRGLFSHLALALMMEKPVSGVCPRLLFTRAGWGLSSHIAHAQMMK